MNVVEYSGSHFAPAAFIFDYVSNYENVPRYILGLERYEPLGPLTSGVGATFAATLDIGAMKLPLDVVVTTWEEGEKVTLHATRGAICADVTFAVTETAPDACNMNFHAEYSVGRGLSAKLLDKAVAVFVKLALKHLDKSLKKQVGVSVAEWRDRPL